MGAPNKIHTYHRAMDTIKNCQTTRVPEVRGAAASTRAQCPDHRVVVEGAISNDTITIQIRNEDFPRRRHNGDTPGIPQCAGGSRQLSHPGAIRGPQHCHSIVARIYHKEEGIVGGQRQATRLGELAGLIAPRTDGAMPLAVQLT